MNYQEKESEQQEIVHQNFNIYQDTDVDDNIHCLPEDDFCSNKMATHKFVIGISKPGQQRIGLQTIEKNKITVKGILGINEQQ